MERRGSLRLLLKPHKPDDDPAPYHPVTLTSNPCNLPERIFSRPVRGHLEDKLQPQQPGLRPHRSTVDPLDLLLRKVVQSSQLRWPGRCLWTALARSTGSITTLSSRR
ncbi:Reverse transcriptase (RNA-dependent DNA polymerase), putative [Leishmania donovani]|uniref:Reverse transcriptase (RNA-dependent DNA polymerase), putative n=1 Tax=Leishmania donovani TaxID=5661 RepID=A0A3Q8IA53_LEIDO|nr:Reverse transcriptase (RNA-dependent DNA polymerase), putative [Leishmania donovani]AYU78454.1 Reverse transcriptase (RNA-dependent DNA polymerase), putative [Leishmania donovani]